MTKRETYRNLGEFIARLDSEGELVRISEEVDPILEITEIADRVSKSPDGGKALLFENVKGSTLPVLINGFGSYKRMAMALGVGEVDEIANQIDSLLNIVPPESIMDKMKMLSLLFDISKFPPKKSGSSAPCQEIVMTGDDIDLGELPVLKCWPGDAGRFITFPLVFTKGLDGRPNLGMYRMQVFDKNTTGMHWHIHKDGAHHFHEYKKAGKRMDVAVVIGSDPVVTWSATAPLPRGIDELLLAGLIRKKPVSLVKCKSVDLYVPAEAEIVLEGYVDPSEEFKMEGPFGDHTGYYSLADYYPLFHVTAVTHRRNPVYFTTIVGKPPMEDCYMANATSRIFKPMLNKVVTEIVDYNLPWEGVFHNCVIVSIEKEFPGAAHRVMNAMWGTGQMSFAKMILAVDEGVDLADYKTLFKMLMDRLDLKQDLFFSEGVLDVLDHSAPEPLRGSKLGIDATRRMTGETERNWGELEAVDYSVIKDECEKAGVTDFNILLDSNLNRLCICSVAKGSPKSAAEVGKDLLESEASRMANIILMVDEGVDLRDFSHVTWKFFNNTDPRRDILLFDAGVVIDATKKGPGQGHDREWPDEIDMDDETKQRVDTLWPKLGIDL